MRKLSVVLALMLLVAVGCGKSEESSSSNEAPPVSLQGTTNNHGTKTASNDMEVELDDFYFSPTYIKATAGPKFTIELSNEAKVAHTFTSNALGNVDEEIAPGTKKTITVTAPAGGMAVFFCRFHQSQGMQGAVFIG